MAIEAERTITLDAPREDVWQFVSNPTTRAETLSIVERYSIDGDGSATWEVDLPIPFIQESFPVETEDSEVKEPKYLKYVGDSKAFSITGEHWINESGGGTFLQLRLTLEAKLPGVELFLSQNIEDEIDNLVRALKRSVEEGETGKDDTNNDTN